jgi:oxygen-dependent protoporphyrinogen oxidase
MAAAVVRRHLNITEEPEVAQTVLHHDAIPQYEVGHLDTIEQIHEALAPFEGRLSVASNWTGLGVGVNDCVFEALCHGKAVANSMSTTGLETAVHYNNFPTKEWVWKPMLPEGKPADSR